MNQMLFNDEYHIAQKKTRIAFLELEIKKIKKGNTKASLTEVLDGVLQQYQKELAELKGSSN
jgi:hypothetical protein